MFKLIILSLVMCYSFEGVATTYISKILALPSDSPNPDIPPGFVLIDVDLNQGAGGKYIYLAYKTTDSLCEALTGLDLEGGSSNDFSFQPGFDKIDQDLNQGAWGKYVYAYTTSNTARPPLKEVAVIVGDTRHTYPPDSSWIRINQDANEGAGGKFIYVIYKTSY